MSLSGFTIVRNASLLNYPFRESVLSVLPLCDEFIINCGKSEDNTLQLCYKLAENPKVKIIETQWNENNQKGGAQLSFQTNQALSLCTQEFCFYIQADEVLHESDYEKIKAAIEIAKSKSKVEGIVFNYLHFYGGYNYTISGRNWYRSEVRILKNHLGISSFRDAQGFRKEGQKIPSIHSGANIFHYGYVRDMSSTAIKSIQMSKWWGTKADLNEHNLRAVRHFGLIEFKDTHPKVMEERMRNYPLFNPKLYSRKWDKNEIKNLITLLFEKIIPYRMGEYKNFEIVS